MRRHDRTLDRYLGDEERVLLETRQHPFAVVAAFSEAIFTLIPLALVMWGISGLDPFQNRLGDWLLRLLLIAMAAVVARLAWHVLQWEHARLIITTEKIIHVHGILQRRIASTPLVKVSELAVIQPITGRMLGFGSLVVDAPGGAQPLHGLAHVPEPIEVYRIINEVARRGRAFEGGADIEPTVEYDPGPDDQSDDTMIVERPSDR